MGRDFFEEDKGQQRTKSKSSMQLFSSNQSSVLHDIPTSEDDPNFKVICMTGGPCGGKTSSLSILSDLFHNLGWKVYRVPETATILLSGGVVFAELSSAQSYSFQKDIIKTMLTLENTYMNLARLDAEKGQKAVVICDRGAMDPSAYMTREDWLQCLKELNLEEAALRDHRYDVVLHLVTAAKGAEHFYTLENNTVRSEGIEMARMLDDKIMNAWNGHASLQVIDNVSVSNFAEKCDRVVQAVMTRLGIVHDAERFGKRVKKHKFLVSSLQLSSEFPVPYRDFNVEHVYLSSSASSGAQIRIRRRAEEGSAAVHLTMTIRQAETNGQRVETRRNLTGREYEALRAQSDKTRVAIRKIRRSFLHKDRYFQIDVFQSPHPDLVILETYLDYDESAPSDVVVSGLLPEWLQLVEITDDKRYSMYELAKI